MPLSVCAAFFCLMAAGLLSYPYIQPDEGIWIYVAKVWAGLGLPPYCGAVENKPAGLFYIHAVPFLAGWTPQIFPRLLGAGMTAGAGFLLWLVARRAAGLWAAWWTLGLFLWLMLGGRVETCNLDTTESFMLFFCVLALYIYSKDGGELPSGGRVFWAGVCAGFSVLFKQTGLATLGALTLWPLLSGATLGAAARHAAFLWAGGLAGHLFGLLPFLFLGGTIPSYIYTAWITLRRLSFSFGFPITPHTRLIGSTKLFLKWIFYIIPLGAGLLWRRRLGIESKFLGLCLICLALDVWAVNSSGEYFIHQSRQMVPTLSLVGGLIMAAVFRLSQLRRLQLAALLVLPTCGAVFYTAENVANTKIVSLDYFAGMRARSLTKPGDYLYICEHNASPVQYYSERYSPTRHFNTMFMFGEKQQREVLEALRRNPPALVMVRPFLPSPDMADGAPPRWLEEGFLKPQGYTFRFADYEYYYWMKGPARRGFAANPLK